MRLVVFLFILAVALFLVREVWLSTPGAEERTRAFVEKVRAAIAEAATRAKKRWNG